MKILYFDAGSGPAVGVYQGDGILPLGGELVTMGACLAAGTGALQGAVDRAQSDGTAPLRLEQVRLLAPLDNYARVFCVGLNYGAHVREAGGTEEPPAPVIFMKPQSAIIGPCDPIEKPAITNFLDYEAELAVVIGRGGAQISADTALSHVGGYTCFNDISARDLTTAKLGEKSIVDWFSGKCLDRTTPVGPWILTADEVGEPSTLQIQLRLNGELLQDASASLMINSIPKLIAYISTRLALWPGDVIATGTPAGVGKARGISLKPGDQVAVTIEPIGTLTNEVVASSLFRPT